MMESELDDGVTYLELLALFYFVGHLNGFTGFAVEIFHEHFDVIRIAGFYPVVQGFYGIVPHGGKFFD